MTPALNRTLHDLQEVTDQALTYTRTLVAQLSPPILRNSACRWHCDGWRNRCFTGTCTCPWTFRRPTFLPEDQAVLLFQSIRELLMNVVKHAGTNTQGSPLRWMRDSWRLL